MATKTKSFDELRKRARQRDSSWGANVAEYRHAMVDALALDLPLHPAFLHRGTRRSPGDRCRLRRRAHTRSRRPRREQRVIRMVHPEC
jgi:hypothetical protein